MLKPLSLSGKFLRSQDRAAFIGFMLGIAGLWLLAHPYRGIIHDSVLYTGQALLTLNPDVFSHDLFFRFGSQDDYTIFSPIYSWLISHLGVGPSSLLLVIAGQLLWVAGAFRLFSKLLPDRIETAAALFIVAAGVSVYSGMGVLLYGEGFATPRLFAEALVLNGLAWLVGGQLLRAMIAGVFAAVFHPLMTLPALAVGALYLAFQDPRMWAIPVAGALAFILLSLVGVAPFDRLFQVMDEAWYDTVAKRSAFSFLTSWQPADWGWVLTHLAGTACAMTMLSGSARRLFLATIVTAIGALVISFIGGEWLKSVLILQLQPWRAAWLLAVAGNAGIGIVVYRLWRQETNALALTSVLSAGALWSAFFAGQVMAVCALVLMAVQVRFRPQEYSRLTYLVCIALALMATVYLGFFRVRLLLSEIILYWRGVTAPGYVIFDFALLTVLCAAIAASPWARKGWRPLAIGGMILLAGMTFWDRRTDLQRTLAVGAGQANPFLPHLGPTDEVFWRRSLNKTWFLLERPSYITINQGAGIVFSRDTALEYVRRSRIVAPLDGRNFLKLWVGDREKKKKMLALTRPEYEDLVQVCRHPDGPDAVVLEFAYDHHWTEKWALPMAVDRTIEKSAPPPDAYYLYLCRQIAGDTAPASQSL